MCYILFMNLYHILLIFSGLLKGGDSNYMAPGPQTVALVQGRHR